MQLDQQPTLGDTCNGGEARGTKHSMSRCRGDFSFGDDEAEIVEGRMGELHTHTTLPGDYNLDRWAVLHSSVSRVFEMLGGSQSVVVFYLGHCCRFGTFAVLSSWT